MIVYHGSSMIVKNPDVHHSMKRLDFGSGFYVTSNLGQAERWARRKARNEAANIGWINSFQFILAPGFAVMDFGEDLEEWIDFVCACREGSDCYAKYDVIKGKVADDKVFRVVDLYKRGIWDKPRAIQEMRAYENYDQMAFVTQIAIDAMLVFQEAMEVKV